ncbi:MAG: universal stress protein [Vicinamibacterales bacterium]
MLNISRILCPVDFSEASRHALEQAAVVAGWFDAPITLLHVYTQVFLPVPGLGMPGYASDFVLGPDERQRLKEEAERFAAPVRAAGARVDTRVEVGQAIAHILGTAQEERADLVVIGTHGASGFEHLVLGSVTEKVLRKAPCPVLTVPPRAHHAATVPFKRILVAVDFSDCSLAALGAALSFAKEADAELTMLHVLDWPEPEALAPTLESPSSGIFDLEGYRRQLEGEALARLEKLVPADAGHWCTPRTLVAHGKAHREILKAAAGADLIVLGVRGRSAIDLALFGSTANQIVRQAVCPVLTVTK